MTATMYILGWRSQGLRCPDHEINCCDSQGKPLSITLVQMPNGTGKTTTLSLLRAALSGSADMNTWSKEDVMDYRKHDGSILTGIFELRLLLNDRLVTIILEFDFENGLIYYKTTRNDGQVDRFDPPGEFLRFMNEDFVRFYVFDGELADNILNRDYTDAQKAVENLFQIHRLNNMQEKVTEYWDDQTRDTTAKDQAGLTRRHKKLEEWKLRLKELMQQRENHNGNLEKFTRDLELQQERHDDEIKKMKNLNERIQEAKEKINKIEGLVREKTLYVLDLMRDPHAISQVFASSMYALKLGLDSVKLPESAAREFFEELADEEFCVCGRIIDNEIRQVIKSRAPQYLGSDDVVLLNSMKSIIEETVGPSNRQAVESLSKDTENLKGLVEQRRDALGELDALNLEARNSDPNVKHAQEEIERLTAEIASIKTQLDQLNGPDEKFNPDRIESDNLERIFSIAAIEEGISYLEDKVAEITRTYALRRKRDLLIKIVDSAHKKARNYVTRELKDDTNKRIAKLMPNNPIRVDRIDRCIILEGQPAGSAGENLSIGYAFLATLFNRSNEHSLPFIVDSPANPIDLDIRPKIGQLIPDLTNQFIAFVISSEREKFLPSLQGIAKKQRKEINYITLFRKRIRNHTERAERNSGHIATSDGMQVIDKGFFSDFQLDSEEDI